MTLEEIKKRAIMDAMIRNDFNISASARELNITMKTVYNKFHSYGWDLQARRFNHLSNMEKIEKLLPKGKE